MAYLNRLLTEARVVEVTEAIPAECGLTEDEWQEVLALDVLVQGQLRPAFAEQLGVSEIWLAVEVSGVVEYSDVERAWERAELLKRCGLWPVVGVVSGKEMTESAEQALNETMGRRFWWSWSVGWRIKYPDLSAGRCLG